MDRRQFYRRLLGAGLAVSGRVSHAAWWSRPAHAVKLAFIDPLTGPAGDIGRNCLNSWSYVAESLYARGQGGGRRFTLAPFDNKGSPRESLNILKVAIDQGFRYVLQGNGSGVTTVLSQAVERHNQQRPDDPVVLINYAAMDPALTREQCSFWHFRVDADTAMKMRALTRFLIENTGYRSVYLLNQNYAHGKQVSHFFKEEMVIPDERVRIVGDELHDPFRLTDFSAQVERIKASGATALVTGNWGADLRNLISALQSAQLELAVFAYYPGLRGTPTVLANPASRLQVFQVSGWHPNQSEPWEGFAEEFAESYGEDFVTYAAYDGMKLLLRAMELSDSPKALNVGRQMSGLVFDGSDRRIVMRKEDHQLVRPVYVSRWQRIGGRHLQSLERTGFTFAPQRVFGVDDMNLPTVCSMSPA